MLLLVGRGITALGAASGLTCTFTLLNEYLDKERVKQATAYAIVSFTLGIGLAVTIGGIVTQYWHWQACFWVLLFHGLIMLALTCLFDETLKTKTPLNAASLIQGYSIALKSRPLIIFSIIVGFCSSVGYLYSAAAPIIAQSQLLLSPSQYGYWNLINMIGMFASGFAAKTLLKNRQPLTVIYIGSLAILACLVSLGVLFLTMSSSSLWFFVTTTLLYFSSGLMYSSATCLAMGSVDCKANASSIMNFLSISTAILSVVILGYLPFNNLLALVLVLSVFWLLVAILLQAGKIFISKT